MTKEDRFGLFGAIFCSTVAYFDDNWRPFWVGCGLLLAAWTVASLWRKFRTR